MTVWRDAWQIAALAVPLPPDRTRPGASDEVGRWQRTFDTAVPTEEAARAWDGWAAETRLRVVQSVGPHSHGLSRIYARDGVSVTIQLCRMPGTIAHVVVHVERPDDLPRTVIADGLLFANGVLVPVAADAVPGVHDDLTDVGGEDVHEVLAAGLDLAGFLALYLPWARSAGLELEERVDGADRCALRFARAEGGPVTVTYLGSETVGGLPVVQLAFGHPRGRVEEGPER